MKKFAMFMLIGISLECLSLSMFCYEYDKQLNKPSINTSKAMDKFSAREEHIKLNFDFEVYDNKYINKVNSNENEEPLNTYIKAHDENISKLFSDYGDEVEKYNDSHTFIKYLTKAII